MRFPSLSFFSLTICLALLAPALTVAQAMLVYRQRTGTQDDRIEFSEEALPDGTALMVTISDGESYRIECDANWAVRTCSFEYPQGHTSWTALREGNTLRLEGTVQGRPVARTFTIDDHPWYEAVERSLQSYAISGSEKQVQFWMIEPYEGNAFLMAGQIQQRERVQVNGKSVEAVRVLVRPVGFLALFWSSEFWFDSLDGLFLQSKSVRWYKSSVPTVTELIEDRRPGR